jgi:CO/xanthine dehydrogenase FAD-binding subunit
VTVQSYFLPSSVPEALGLLETHGAELLVIAGGTIAMPAINEGMLLPTRVMGLRRAGLDRVERVGDELHLGATTTLSAVARLEDVPLLRAAALRTGAWGVRNMATVGGNLFTPSPGGDVAVALLALDAVAVIAGSGGARTVPLAQFWTGFMSTVVGRDELLTSITVPVRPRPEAYVKFGRRHANTLSVVTVAIRASLDGGVVHDARVALGAAAPHPIRSAGAEAALEGRPLDDASIAAAAAAAQADSEPFTDAVATADYRRRMVGVFVRRALDDLAGSATAAVNGKEA